ncbi:MAG TPA: alpha/beta fold hydrolase [Candidatus Baltobacteraceae bacterium]|nr:alpha/beta fold hydrolase [Candidatus Baltobacteraceae bacterium]
MSARIAQARARLEAIAARERHDPRIHPYHGTRRWLHAHVTPLAVVLLHGLTNAPPQYDLLGAELAARGHNVLALRMPYHGYRDRMTDALANLRAADLEAYALRSLALGALCGERVVVAGISVGAVLAGWLAARARVDTALAIAPFCGLHALPGAANDALGAALRALPNAFGWWDPRRRKAQPPSHGYPRFATRALGASIAPSTRLARARDGEHARRAVLVLNEHDPVINNAHARRRFAALARRGVAVETVVLQGLPHIHDVIEPAIPQAAVERVYPELFRLIEG